MQTETQQAVITGGSGFLGRAIAAGLQSPAWVVAAPGSAGLDVRDALTVQKYFDQRPVDLLVCAAGVTRDGLLHKTTEADWDEVWAVNYQGASLCADAVLPGMIEQRRGHIIFISSYSAICPPPGQAAYATAKAALLGLAADLAVRHGPANIRVNVVLPGFLETRMTATVTERRRTEILAAHALARFNTCRHTAAFIHFLHHQLPHTSGQTFQLDSRAKVPCGT